MADPSVRPKHYKRGESFSAVEREQPVEVKVRYCGGQRIGDVCIRCSECTGD